MDREPIRLIDQEGIRVNDMFRTIKQPPGSKHEVLTAGICIARYGIRGGSHRQLLIVVKAS